jgi:hypothetical protein
MKYCSFIIATLFCTSAAWSAVSVDVNVSLDRASAASTIQSPTFSTVSGSELLLAFVAADYVSGTNTVVSSVAGGGLTWQLVVRANGQSGTSEIWRAFTPSALQNTSVVATLSHSVVSSITVVSFLGVDTSGVAGVGAIGATASKSSASGAPTASVVTTRDGSLVLGVGNDFDNAVPRIPGTNQMLVHQDLTPTGDTYWVQMLNAPVALSGTKATLNDTAPTQDRYNLALVEVLASPSSTVSGFDITGSIIPSTVAQGAVITLSQNGSTFATATVDSAGNFGFNNITNGNYTLTPAKAAVIFDPPSESLTVNGANISAPGFSASAQTWSLSGALTPALAGAVVNLSGASTSRTTTDSSGAFIFSGLSSGTYTVTPSNPGYSFTPPSQTLNVTANMANVNFNDAQTWTVSGNVGTTTPGVTVSLGGALSATAKTDSSGSYTFAGLTNGTYTVTPSLSGLAFTPTSLSVVVNGSDVTGENFSAQTVVPTGLALDVSVSADSPTAALTVSTPSLSTKSGGELLLAFVAGDYLSGANTIVTGVSGGGLTWNLVRRTNNQKGSAEIWSAFAASQLTSTVVSATLSQKVIASISLLSFSGVDSSATGGLLGIGATASGSAASGAPAVTLATTRPASMIFAVGNDYDSAIGRTPATGQTVLHQFLTRTGDTYWLQRLDGITAAAGTAIKISDVAPTSDRYNFSAVEVLPAAGGVIPPPAVNLISPASNSTIAGLTTLGANASSQGAVIAQVAFLVDGVNVGASASTPYFPTWDSKKVADGSHTIVAIATDSTGQSTTSSPLSVIVDNSGDGVIVGSWSLPVNLNAVAVNLVLLKNGKLLFYDDGATPSVWDYNANVFSAVPTNADLFCSGHAALADGRILVVGGYGDGSGSIGISNAEIFDSASNTWTTTPNMSYKRWYPTATTLSDGRILVTAGWQTTNHTNAGIPEIYDPVVNSWTKLTNANNPFETYPFIFMLSDGRILHVGGSEYATDTDVLDLTSQTWSVIDDRLIDGGSATMYLPDKIMKAGSATDSQNTGPSSNTTFVLDMSQPLPKWQQTASMTYARSFMNLTELPDGSVLATGGESDKDGGNISNAVYAAELWSPATQTWTTMASMHTPREYHSTALLLPDGRVVESGMGADFGNVPDQQTAEFFSPPYLFKGARPTIAMAPSLIHYGATFSVTTPDAATIQKAVLIRLGAATHFFDQNTRYVPLTMQVGTGTLTLTAPADGKSAPPGYYMLFIVNSAGVPSVAPILQLGS